MQLLDAGDRLAGATMGHDARARQSLARLRKAIRFAAVKILPRPHSITLVGLEWRPSTSA
jgi:hypothetical protein